MLGERILQLLESAASLYAHGQIGPGVFDHLVESRHREDKGDTPPAVHRTTAVGEKFLLDLRAAPDQMRNARAALFLDRAPHTSLTSSFSSLHRHHVHP